MVASIFLVIITIIKGFKVEENPFFILIEVLLNLLILIDFVCRVKIMTVKRFLEGGFWNYFDAFVVFGSIILFILLLLTKSGVVFILEEVSEEICLVCWGAF
jgi:hypothetical protein